MPQDFYGHNQVGYIKKSWDIMLLLPRNLLFRNKQKQMAAASLLCQLRHFF